MSDDLQEDGGVKDQPHIHAWAKRNQPLAGLLASCLTIGAVLWALVKFVFAPPDLAITVNTTQLSMPWYRYQELDRAIARDSARFSDSVGRTLRELRGFLRDTDNYTQVSLTNTTKRSLSNVDLRFKYVRALDGWAIDSDNLDSDERKKLLDAVKYDGAGEIVSLRSIARFPPKSTIKVSLWGDIGTSPFLEDDQVIVTFDGGVGERIRERTVRGVDAFIYDNAGLLTLAVLLLNAFIWSLVAPRPAPQST
jgi:hypothetical protein